MRRLGMAVLLVTAVALLLSGCMNIREQAESVAARIADLEDRADGWDEATARNAGLIRELQNRISELEAQVEALAEQTPSAESLD